MKITLIYDFCDQVRIYPIAYRKFPMIKLDLGKEVIKNKIYYFSMFNGTYRPEPMKALLTSVFLAYAENNLKFFQILWYLGIRRIFETLKTFVKWYLLVYENGKLSLKKILKNVFELIYDDVLEIYNNIFKGGQPRSVLLETALLGCWDISMPFVASSVFVTEGPLFGPSAVKIEVDKIDDTLIVYDGTSLINRKKIHKYVMEMLNSFKTREYLRCDLVEVEKLENWIKDCEERGLTVDYIYSFGVE